MENNWLRFLYEKKNSSQFTQLLNPHHPSNAKIPLDPTQNPQSFKMWELYLNPEASIENRDSSYVVPYTFEKKNEIDGQNLKKEGNSNYLLGLHKNASLQIKRSILDIRKPLK